MEYATVTITLDFGHHTAQNQPVIEKILRFFSTEAYAQTAPNIASIEVNVTGGVDIDRSFAADDSVTMNVPVGRSRTFEVIANIDPSDIKNNSIDKLVFPYPELLKNIEGFGYLPSKHEKQDGDFSHQVYVSYKGSFVPSLALRIAISYYGLKPAQVKVGQSSIVIKDKVIPLINGRMYMPMGVILADNSKSLEIFTKGGNIKVESLDVYKLASIWR